MNEEINKTGQAPDVKLDVNVRLIEPRGNLMGFANVTVADSLRIDDFKILQGENGLFVGMPSKPAQGKDGKTNYYETVRPTSKEFRAALNEAVVSEYNAEVERLQARAASLRSAPEKTPIREQLEKAGKEAALDNATRPAPTKGKGKEMRNDR